jgi:hypothetical protein
MLFSCVPQRFLRQTEKVMKNRKSYQISGLSDKYIDSTALMRYNKNAAQ